MMKIMGVVSMDFVFNFGFLNDHYSFITKILNHL